MTGTRRYLLADFAGAAREVRFDDGRPFHALDLSAGTCPVRHDCPPDVYDGAYRVLDADRFTVRWTVTGPRKDSVLETTFTREYRRGRAGTGSFGGLPLARRIHPTIACKPARHAPFPRAPRRLSSGAAMAHSDTATNDTANSDTALPQPVADWFAEPGMGPHAHQLEMLAAARAGRSALLIAPTGGGKTLAGFLPSLCELAERRGPACTPSTSRP